MKLRVVTLDLPGHLWGGLETPILNPPPLFLLNRTMPQQSSLVSKSLGFALLGLLIQTQGAAAFDAGDAIALIVGLILGFIIICACLGWYSRRV